MLNWKWREMQGTHSKWEHVSIALQFSLIEKNCVSVYNYSEFYTRWLLHVGFLLTVYICSVKCVSGLWKALYKLNNCLKGKVGWKKVIINCDYSFFATYFEVDTLCLQDHWRFNKQAISVLTLGLKDYSTVIGELSIFSLWLNIWLGYASICVLIASNSTGVDVLQEPCRTRCPVSSILGTFAPCMQRAPPVDLSVL